MTPNATIEAVKFTVRERGVEALDEPANIARLITFDAGAFGQLNEFADEARAALRRAGHLRPVIVNDDWEPPLREPDGPREGDEIIVTAQAAAKPLAPLEFIDAASLADHDAPPRRWLVPNRIPAGNVTLLSGDGAAGKTTIALQLAVATLKGDSWLNAVVDQQGPAMFFSAEEDLDEIHRRMAAISAHRGRGIEALGGLHVLGLPGQDALLGVADRSGVIRPTPLFEALSASASAVQPALIVIEAAADTFGGNENDRSQVRQFIGLLRRLCNAAGGSALVLIAHPSLSGMASGSGMSGSTGWSNSVRSRLYFSKARTKGDDEPESDIRELQVMKSNYGPAGEVIRARWERGVFVPEGGASSLQRASAEADAEYAYLACLDTAAAQGRYGYPNPGRNYAPKVFAEMTQAQRLSWRALQSAQERLFAAGRIHVVNTGPPSKRVSRIDRKTLIIDQDNTQ